MAVFSYRAARADGTTFEGHIEGDDEHLVRAKLESDGLLVFRLSRRGAGIGVPGLPAGRWGKLPLQDFLVFNQELATLLKAGMPLVQSLDILRQRLTNPVFKAVLDDVHEKVRGGSALSGVSNSACSATS